MRSWQLFVLFGQLILTAGQADTIAACFSSEGHEDDVSYEACFGWCSASQATDHCGWCKVRIFATVHTLNRSYGFNSLFRSAADATGVKKPSQAQRSFCPPNLVCAPQWIVKTCSFLIVKTSVPRTLGRSTASSANARLARSVAANPRTRKIHRSKSANHGALQIIMKITVQDASVKVVTFAMPEVPRAHQLKLATQPSRLARIFVTQHLPPHIVACVSAKDVTSARAHSTLVQGRAPPGSPTT